MAINFTELELGMELMDREHRQLALLLGEFAECFQSYASPDKAERLVEKALSLCNAHFEHEEELMDEVHYPHIEEHKVLHRNLRLQITTLAGVIVPNVSVHDPNTLVQLNDMSELMKEHIRGSDTALVQFIREVTRH